MRLALLVFTLTWPIALAQPPRLASGRIEVSVAGSDLAQQLRGLPGPTWVGYTIEAVPGHRGCCTTMNNGTCAMGCSLEGGTFAGSTCSVESTAYLEGERTATILFRVDKGEVERVRVFSTSCQLDIAGLTLHWLTGVHPAKSVSLLRALAVKNTVSVIAVHADPSADAFLRETALSISAPRNDRERAARSLASSRGPAGLEVVLKLLQTDTDERFRESLPGAIALASDGTSALIDIARRDKNRKVRERAFFWLDRSKDPQAQRFVEQILSK